MFLTGVLISMILAKNNNFIYLILGRLITNFGDSLYFVSLTYITISLFDLGVRALALFGLVAFIPSLLSFAFGPFIDNFRNKKLLLVLFEFIQLLSVLGVLFVVYYRSEFIYLIIFHFLFSLTNTLIYPVQSSFVPQILNNNKEQVEKSVYIMNVSNNLTDITSNFIASIILLSMSIVSILTLDLATFVISILLFLKISSVPSQKSVEKNTTYSSDIVFSFKYFLQEKVPSRIVIMEGILSGLTTMIMRIVGAYFVIINVGVEYLGVLLAVQKGSEMLGTLVSEKIKMQYKNFFMIDYLLSGTAIIFIVFIDSIAIKLGLFSLTFILIGMSGTVYGKMIYHYYEYDHLGKVSTVINTVSSIAIVTSMIIPLVYENVVNLILITGIITVLFGSSLLFFDKQKKEKKIIQ